MVTPCARGIAGSIRSCALQTLCGGKKFAVQFSHALKNKKLARPGIELRTFKSCGEIAVRNCRSRPQFSSRGVLVAIYQYRRFVTLVREGIKKGLFTCPSQGCKGVPVLFTKQGVSNSYVKTSAFALFQFASSYSKRTPIRANTGDGIVFFGCSKRGHGQDWRKHRFISLPVSVSFC